MQAPFERYKKHPLLLAKESKVWRYLQKHYYVEDFCQLVTESISPSYLPAASKVGEEVNQKNELKRIEFILRLMNFLSRIDLNRGKPLHYDDKEWEELKRSIHIIAYDTIHQIGIQIFNLPKSLRTEYDGYFQPKPFSWFTLEQFGGMARFYYEDAFISCRYGDAIGHALGTAFIGNELAQRGELLLAAMPRILKEDFPLLERFFKAIRVKLINNDDDTALPIVELPAIKAIVSHLRDAGTLHELLLFITNNEGEAPPAIFIKRDFIIRFEARSAKINADSRYNFTTKTGKFAALRRLQLIGELLKGSNFSKQLTNLFTEIDWEAFVIIRNASIHQDQGCNRSKILHLLNEPKFLKLIYDVDLNDLAKALKYIVEVRAQIMGPINPDRLADYAEKIHCESQRFYEQLAKKQHDMMQEAISLPVTPDRHQLFMLFVTLYNKVLAGQGIEQEQKRFIDLYCRFDPEICEITDYSAIDSVLTAALNSCKKNLEEHHASADNNRITEEILSKLDRIFSGKVTNFADYSPAERGLVLRPLADKYWRVSDVSKRIVQKLNSIHNRVLEHYTKRSKKQSELLQQKIRQERPEKRGTLYVRVVAAYLDAEYAAENPSLKQGPVIDNNRIYEPIDDLGQFKAIKELFNDLFDCLKEMDVNIAQLSKLDLLMENTQALTNLLTKSLRHRYAIEYLLGQLGLHFEALREAKIITPETISPILSFRYRLSRNHLEHGYSCFQRFEFHPKTENYLPESNKIENVARLTCLFISHLMPKLGTIQKNLHNKIAHENAKANARDRLMLWSSLLQGPANKLADKPGPDNSGLHSIVPKSN